LCALIFDGEALMTRKTLVTLLPLALLFLHLPVAKADGEGGCGPGSGSSDATCVGNITETVSPTEWSGTVQGTITNAFTLSPTDPAFVVGELGAPDVNLDQFTLTFDTGTGSGGTYSLEDTTNDAYLLTGEVVGFTQGLDSITLTLTGDGEQTFYLAGSPCSLADESGCVLTAPPTGTAVSSTLTDEPDGTVTINYEGDPKVTSMTFDFPTTAPEPSGLPLLGIGLAGLGIVAFWRKRTADAVL
jgi:PEP-CTERM motif